MSKNFNEYVQSINEHINEIKYLEKIRLMFVSLIKHHTSFNIVLNKYKYNDAFKFYRKKNLTKLHSLHMNVVQCIYHHVQTLKDLETNVKN